MSDSMKRGDDARNDCFRMLVEDLIEESSLLPEWVNPTNPDEKMSVLDAIEGGEATLYLDEYASDEQINAVTCLFSVYVELENEEPDDDFIQDTIEQLKEYL